ncbi:hypothetical protein [Corynebacterium aquatimens]|uniref:Uncharacterized protein n=1 Tax=Corynebacterium aquatimens TaxID=1190508 RepID=A0A931DYT4_9CORY|nr:hypothetical protein [Corynebacterium aquatimens]MBG6121519.1 hypothetical protein [Corynebacterium aquatimens]WJY65938.1 hypothetical protein CAQUA_06165 [Corynebacterium aquatimens]
MAPYSRTSLESDSIFSDGWDDQLPEFTGTIQSGYDMTLDVAIDTSTPNTGGGMGGPGGQPPQGGPGGTPPTGAPPAGKRPSGSPPTGMPAPR